MELMHRVAFRSIGIWAAPSRGATSAEGQLDQNLQIDPIAMLGIDLDRQKIVSVMLVASRDP
jgi:hypothetical protein